MKLHNLKKIGKKKSKRIGRGYGSSKGGHTVGFGQKGQTSRSGYRKLRSWIRQSGILSLPKKRGVGKRSALRGYFKSSINRIVLNVSDFNRLKDGTVVNYQFLQKMGILKGKSKKFEIKVLGRGDIERRITIKGLSVSRKAREKIVKQGGKVSSK